MTVHQAYSRAGGVLGRMTSPVIHNYTGTMPPAIDEAWNEAETDPTGGARADDAIDFHAVTNPPTNGSQTGQVRGSASVDYYWLYPSYGAGGTYTNRWQLSFTADTTTTFSIIYHLTSEFDRHQAQSHSLSLTYSWTDGSGTHNGQISAGGEGLYNIPVSGGSRYTINLNSSCSIDGFGYGTRIADYFSLSWQLGAATGPAELAVAIDNPTVHPNRAVGLHLGSVYSGEKLVVPVAVTNTGFSHASGTADISFYVSPTPNYDPQTAVPVQSGNLTGQPIELEPSEEASFDATITIPRDDTLHAGDRVFVVAVLSSSVSDRTPTDTTQPYEYLGTASAQFPSKRYFKVVRDTLRGIDPFALIGDPRPSDGAHFTADFESNGGYDHPNLAPYLDTHNPPIATIGIGLNLESVGGMVEQMLAADVRAYYLANYQEDLSGQTDDQIVQMLIDQAGPDAPQALTVQDAQALFNVTYANATTIAMNYVGSNWSHLTTTARITVIDLAFNVGADGLAGFQNLQRDLQQGPVDYVRCGFDLLDSARSSQVQYARILADYEYFLTGYTNQLGSILG